MRIFELHFNPKRIGEKEKTEANDIIFDSFCYTPSNIYERRLGSLIIAGEIKNVLPQNLKFLDTLALEVKKRYYSSPVKSSPETSFKNCLGKTNDFLEEIAKKGDVSWLGNLSVAVFASVPQKKNVIEVNFTKVGDIKLLLLRQGRIMDIGKNLELTEMEPYPLKMFGNIVSGKLAEGDVVVILTPEVFNFFHEQRFLEEMAQIPTTGSAQNFETGLRKFLKGKEEQLSNLTGLCLVGLLVKESWAQSPKPKTSLIYQKEPEKFSIKKAFFPLVNRIKIPAQNFSKGLLLKFKNIPKKIPKLKRDFPKKTEKKEKKLNFQKWWNQKKEQIKLVSASNKLVSASKRNLILVILLALVLVLGFLIFG